MIIVLDGEGSQKHNKINEMNLCIKNSKIEKNRRNIFEAGSGNYSNCFRC